ncbi:MAG: hypothetical protein NNA20_12855 [Nitrospira sp.]|nr:hypothetical protein [Nitrospira sp.]MCP9443463.1 hypothetical protein [Nitrospira sp.]
MVMETRWVLAVFFVVSLVVPAWAGEPESFDPDEPFQQAFSSNLLRALLNKALDQLEDYVELSGHLAPDETAGDRLGHLRVKIYPEGKSKSRQHVEAQGWFRLTPDDTIRDFSFHFKNPDKQTKNSSPRSENVL